jgi:ankyrin repeat protein
MYSGKGNLVKVKETVDLIMQDKVQGYQNVCKGDYDDRTALHLACSEGHYPIVQFFIENGFFEEI